MTKKDFQLIAATIAALAVDDHIQQHIAEYFASMLAPTNPRFKRDLFIQAATGQVSVMARKTQPLTIKLDAQGRDSDGNRREYR